MAKYEVYGDYALVSECLLEEFDTYAEAERFVDGYIYRSDMGGYKTIEVIRFTADGEAITEYIVGEEDIDRFYEGDDDFALIDEF